MFNLLHYSKLNTFTINTLKRGLSKNYYDVLKLSRNCTNKEVRQAFLKLTKQYHPDRSNNKDSHAKYVQILEAYKVLSKPHDRHLYDLGLINPNYNNVIVRHGPANSSTYTHGFWEQRDRNEDKYYESRPYYGIKGMKKISNFWIVLFCFIFASAGVSLQILAIRHSFTLHRDEMDKKSAELAELHAKIRLKALQNGDKKQIELLKENLGHVHK